MGSLVALWLLQHTTAQLWLLGRSGRAAGDAAFKPDLAGDALVHLARGDVSSIEETAFVLSSAVSSAQTLEVQHLIHLYLPMSLPIAASCEGSVMPQGRSCLGALSCHCSIV